MQRYFTNLKKDNLLFLQDNDLYHIKTVMRMKPYDKIEVVYNGQLYICKLDINYNALIVEQIKNKKNRKIEYILCVPILQEQKMSFILQKSTELGVDQIVPIITERSKINLKDKEEKKIVRWQRICKEASEQAKRLDIPKITEVKKLNELAFNG